MLAVAVGAQRVVGHRRPEVAAADADVHDVADPPAGVAEPRARRAPARRSRPSCRAPRAPRARRRRRRPRATVPSRRPQRDVQHGAVLGDVDPLARGTSPSIRSLQPGPLGQRDSRPQRLVGDPVLGVVEVAGRRPRRSAARPARGRRRTGPAGGCRAAPAACALEGGPLGRLVDRIHHSRSRCCGPQSDVSCAGPPRRLRSGALPARTRQVSAEAVVARTGCPALRSGGRGPCAWAAGRRAAGG